MAIKMERECSVALG